MSTEISFNIKKIKDKIDKLSKENIVLKAGFFQSDMAKIAEIQEYGAVINVTPKMRGWFKHNFGINKSNAPIVIPPRPFMHVTVKENKNKWNKQLLESLKNKSPFESMQLLGEKMVANIQNTITNNSFVDNAPFTIMKKGRNEPLVDTGKMTNSVEYKVI